MNKIFYILFLGLTLLGCVATAAAVKTLQPATPPAEIEQNHNEMLEFAIILFFTHHTMNELGL